VQPLPDIAYTPLLVGEAQVQHGRAQHGVTKPDGPRVLWLWDPEAVAQRSPLARALTDAEEDPAALVAALRDEAADAPIHGAWPLDLAIYRESLAYVQALLEAGADPSQGRALLMACRTDRPYRFLGALLAAGARPADPLGFVADADVHVQAMLAEAWEVPTPPRVPFAALDAHDWAEVHPRLTRAFDALRDAGLTTRLHGAYTQGEALSWVPDGTSWCFVTAQSMERDPVLVSFGADDPEEAEAVGARVVAALRDQGLSVAWSGSGAERIEVSLVDSLSASARRALQRGDRTPAFATDPRAIDGSLDPVDALVLGLAERDGGWVVLSARAIRKRSGGQVTERGSPRMATPQSLYCPTVFSGPDAIGHLELPVPVLHPWFVPAVADALGLSPIEVRQIALGIAGWRDGWMDAPENAGDTCGSALRRALPDLPGFLDALPVLPLARRTGPHGERMAVEYGSVLTYVERYESWRRAFPSGLPPFGEGSYAVWKLLDPATVGSAEHGVIGQLV